MFCGKLKDLLLALRHNLTALRSGLVQGKGKILKNPVKCLFRALFCVGSGSFGRRGNLGGLGIQIVRFLRGTVAEKAFEI